MNINKKTKICGIPIIKIRDFLRRYRTPGLFSLQVTSKYYNQTEENCLKLVNELLKLGYIEDVGQNDYQVTVKGNALAMTKFVSRINKSKADQVFKNLLERAKEINGNDDYIYRIRKLFLFGSYLNPDTNDFGDIDIAYELERKITDDKNFHDASERIIRNAIENGKVFDSIVDELYYPETLVLRFLKNRSPYISLHRAEELTELSATYKQIFP